MCHCNRVLCSPIIQRQFSKTIKTTTLPLQELRSLEAELSDKQREQRMVEERLRQREAELAEREIDLLQRELNIMIQQGQQEVSELGRRSVYRLELCWCSAVATGLTGAGSGTVSEKVHSSQ